MADFYSPSFRRKLEEAAYTVVVTSDSDDSDKPNYECAPYRELKDGIEFMRACYGGTETMRDQSFAMLPRLAREEPDDYQKRLRCAIAYNAVQKTVRGLTGLIFRKDPKIAEDVPEQLVEDLRDIDRLGHNLPTFLRSAAENALVDGYTWWHVDAPAMQPSSRAEAAATNARPYWVAIRAEDAINWQWDEINGRIQLSLFVYRESYTVNDGGFGAEEVTRYRVLRPGTYEVWEDSKDEKGSPQFAMVEEGTYGLDEIPVVYLPVMESGPFYAHPPFRDVANLQVAHYQRHSMYDRALDYAVPMAVFKGITKGDVEVGPNRALYIPDTEGDAYLLEMTGAALGANREQLQDYKADMAQLGLSMLMRETRAAETAEAKRMDKASEDSDLAAFVAALEDAVNRALYFHAQYRNLEVDEAVSINRDFTGTQMDAQMIQTLSNLVSVGQLSLDTLWGQLQQGEVLPENFDPDVEMASLDVMPQPLG